MRIYTVLDYKKKLDYFSFLWSEREDMINEYHEEIDLNQILLLENNIKKIGFELSSSASDNKQFLLNKFTSYLNQLEETCIAYVLFNTYDYSLFGQGEYEFKDPLNKIISNPDHGHDTAFRIALRFSSKDVAKHFINVLMRSGLKSNIVTALELVSQFSPKSQLQGRLELFNSELANGRYDDRFVKASCYTQNRELVNELYRTLELDFIKASDNNPLRKRIYEALLALGESSIWKPFLDDYISRLHNTPAISIVGKYGGPKQALFLSKQLDDLSDPYWTEACIWAFNDTGDLRIMESIFYIFENTDSDEIKNQCIGAYGTMTGQGDEIEIDLELEDHEHVAETLRWWWENDKTEKDFDLTKRYMDGKLFSIKTLIDELTDLNDSVRMSAKQKLFAYTGECFTFNDRGFFVDMIEQQKVWYEWYHQNKSQSPDGHWYLGGKMVE